MTQANTMTQFTPPPETRVLKVNRENLTAIREILTALGDMTNVKTELREDARAQVEVLNAILGSR